MQKVYLFLLPAILYSFSSTAQQSDEVYKKPLTEVLATVEKNFNVSINYDKKGLKDLYVNYATWRFTSQVENTLDNILLPLNLTYSKVSEKIFEIQKYEFYRRTELEGKKHLDQLLTLYSTPDAFNARKQELKSCFFATLGIRQPLKKSPLNPIIISKVVMNGYQVKNVAFESMPGYFVTGTLYEPTKAKGLLPVILSPHGHFYNEQDPSIAKDSGRYRADMQYRCASLARMGAIVFNYDMYAWGESARQTGGYAYHETGFALAIQTWNSIRALDFLLSLANADKTKVGVTGASGGGTQNILVAALDDRITASVPVVMVSSSFYGGCPCESGLPIHDCGIYKTNNAEIAAMIAPRPQLVISDGSDWTKSVPGTDYPYLQKVYSLYNKEENITQVYLPDEHHDYGYSKRVPMYRFFAKEFGLNLGAISGKDGTIDESAVTVQMNRDMLVFGQSALPANALKDNASIVKAFSVFQSFQ
jgi:dienelactone hydrolase